MVWDLGRSCASNEEEDKVFELYCQSKGAHYQRGGSGIGLALTKELVQLHGGNITLESEIGKGSCFSIILLSEKMENAISKSTPDTILVNESYHAILAANGA